MKPATRSTNTVGRNPALRRRTPSIEDPRETQPPSLTLTAVFAPKRWRSVTGPNSWRIGNTADDIDDKVQRYQHRFRHVSLCFRLLLMRMRRVVAPYPPGLRPDYEQDNEEWFMYHGRASPEQGLWVWN